MWIDKSSNFRIKNYNLMINKLLSLDQAYF